MIGVTNNSPQQINAALIAMKNEILQEKSGKNTNSFSTSRSTEEEKENVAINYYGECTDAANVQNKTATVNDLTILTEGTKVAIKFTNSNSASNPTLNINGTGAIAMMRYGTTAIGTSDRSSWTAGTVQEFIYDGTYWRIVDYQQNVEWANSTNMTYLDGVCTTASAESKKICYLRGWSLTSGISFLMHLTNANTAQSGVTLNVNNVSGQAKPLWFNGKAIDSTNYDMKRDTYVVTYDGTNYVARPIASDVNTLIYNDEANSVTTRTVYLRRPIVDGMKFTVKFTNRLMASSTFDFKITLVGTNKTLSAKSVKARRGFDETTVKSWYDITDTSNHYRCLSNNVALEFTVLGDDIWILGNQVIGEYYNNGYTYGYKIMEDGWCEQIQETDAGSNVRSHAPTFTHVIQYPNGRYETFLSYKTDGSSDNFMMALGVRAQSGTSLQAGFYGISEKDKSRWLTVKTEGFLWT